MIYYTAVVMSSLNEVNTSLNTRNCCYLYYNQNTNKLYMRNDTDTSWIGGYAPSSSYVIENSYDRLDCSKTTVTGSAAVEKIFVTVQLLEVLRRDRRTGLNLSYDDLLLKAELLQIFLFFKGTAPGPVMTIKWNVMFKKAFFDTKVKKTFLYVRDDLNGSCGWIQKGIWMITAPTLPAVTAPEITLTDPIENVIINAEP